jgi:hypothetical protein
MRQRQLPRVSETKIWKENEFSFSRTLTDPDGRRVCIHRNTGCFVDFFQLGGFHDKENQRRMRTKTMLLNRRWQQKGMKSETSYSARESSRDFNNFICIGHAFGR